MANANGQSAAPERGLASLRSHDPKLAALSERIWRFPHVESDVNLPRVVISDAGCLVGTGSPIALPESRLERAFQVMARLCRAVIVESDDNAPVRPTITPDGLILNVALSGDAVAEFH